jgi:hypothetical protein
MIIPRDAISTIAKNSPLAQGLSFLFKKIESTALYIPNGIANTKVWQRCQVKHQKPSVVDCLSLLYSFL